MELRDHQKDALEKLGNGKILCGGVGSGKTITSLAYFKKTGLEKLLVITTAKKRDSGEWEEDAFEMGIYKGDCFVVDSWNNISKYEDLEGWMIVFDEQRLVGSGAWVKSFYKLASKNQWILLSATPGDVWLDYVPVFVANGFYKHKTDFTQQHVIYSRFTQYPKVDGYVGTKKLERLRREILVPMPFERHTERNQITVNVDYDEALMKRVMKDRWDVYSDQPIQNAGGLCYVMRRVANSHPSRVEACLDIARKHRRVIVFYNFDFELEILEENLRGGEVGVVSQWNGHRHDPVPEGERWVYLVQYTAGSEGWNCTTTDTIVFYSQTYSYRTLEQAMGRIDRMNTTFTDLYYYHLRSPAKIDFGIRRALNNKKDFNARAFVHSFEKGKK